jgi:sugar phosphate isomerase/epimerase
MSNSGATRRTFLGVPAAAVLARSGQGKTPNDFFAMDSAMVRHLGKDIIPESDIKLVARLGYAGMSVGLPDPAASKRLAEQLLPWLDARRLSLFAIYCNVHLERDAYTYNTELKKSLALLKGRRTVVWLPIVTKTFPPSDPAGDSMAVAVVREIADLAAAQGMTVSLYHHAGSLMERVADIVRIAEKAGRANVGVTFNLCHWLRTDAPDSLEQTLKLALPQLSMVTINGADRDGKDWVKLIRPLDTGTFDVAALLRDLLRLGYKGPIGLQGYDVANHLHIEPGENLRRSMAAWKKLSGRST